MHMPLLNEILILLGFSVLIVLVLQRLRLPSSVGFLITGVVIGPFGFSLITAVHEVEILAEIGVILLLFVIGMELSLKQLAAMRRTVFLGGSIQVFGTVSVAAAGYFFLGHSWAESVFIGFLFSLSSTAVVLKTFQDRRELNSPHARNALGILIFQDLIVVPMMLVTPMFTGQVNDVGIEVLNLVLKSVGVVVATWVLARYVVPPLLHSVAKTNSKDLFLLFTLTLGFAVAFLTAEAGLSLALGAFIAGLILSESEYSHQATSVILPLRELFTSFFFISIGMLLDWRFFLAHFEVIALLLGLLFVVKSALAAGAVAALRYRTRTALITGLSLFQVGEFAFILSRVGIDAGLMNDEIYQYFLSVSISSMVLTPFVIIGSEYLAKRVLRISKNLGLTERLDRWARSDGEKAPEGLQNHLIIVGYGVNGQNVALAAKANAIPFIVIDFDSELVHRERAFGVPMIFGDASQDHLLEAAQIGSARAIVVAISDVVETRRVVAAARHLAPLAFIVVRTRYVKEIAEFIAIGADEVVPEEFETSIQMFHRVLENYGVTEGEILKLVGEVRADNYELLQRKKRG
jgi:CPA2 family monovalent cation:H+ antiporter-2